MNDAQTVKIATWNLRRPSKLDARLERLLRKVREVDADIWILTETHDVAVPGNEYRAHSSTQLGGIFVDGERRTTVWSRLPIVSEVPVADHHTAACIEVETPLGKMIVYGTVLPYGNAGTNYAYQSGGRLHEGRKAWEVHCESIAEHEHDLRRIVDQFPNHIISFGGDLNQSRDGRRWTTGEWYGTKSGRELLSQSLANVGLKCVTEQDFVESGHLTNKSSIDHLCISKSISTQVTSVTAWETTASDDKPDTDHNGVVIELMQSS